MEYSEVAVERANRSRGGLSATSERVHDMASAALFVGLTKAKLQNIIHQRNAPGASAPAFYRPSPKTTLFRECDLITWKASWYRHENTVVA